MRNLEVWYARLDEDAIRAQLRRRRPQRSLAGLEKGAAKARAKDSLRALDRLTHRVDGELRIVSRPPLIVPLEELIPGEGRDEVEDDAARRRSSATRRRSRTTAAGCSSPTASATSPTRWSGVGSVGTRAWIVLMTGRDDEDPLFLQAKEAQASVLEPYAGASGFDNHGQRVVEGQWLMQAASDSFLGWCPAVEGIDGRRRDFYVRQLWDGKGSVEVEAMAPHGAGDLRPALRLDPGPRPRPLRRPGRDRRLPRLGRGLRRGDRRVLAGATPTRTKATTPRCGRRSTRGAWRPRTPEPIA